MMRVLNIHGYEGHWNNTNFNILTNANFTVHSPQFDYLHEDPNDILDKLSRIVEEYNIDVIVATSFGAFFGKIVSLKYNIPLVATNPCLSPDISLVQIAPNYFANDINASFIFENVRRNDRIGYDDDTFIIGTKDEIVEPKLTMLQTYGATIYKVKGKHQLDADTYRDILVREVLNHVQND